MNYEILSVETAKKLRDYELLKKYIKKEKEKDSYFAIDKIIEFVEMLEGKENNE